MAITETPRTRISSTMIRLVFALAAFALLSGSVMLAQNYQVIHTFSGGGDGATPDAGLTPDGHGNYYGTTSGGGAHGYGAVFKITPHGSNWILSTPYSFNGGADGGWPTTGVTLAPDGSLYGANSSFGPTVYHLRPSPTRPASVLAGWTETTLYQFQGLNDGFNPSGNLVFDRSGNIYGAMEVGGPGCYEGCGSIYELSPSGEGWQESVVYSFQGGTDGEAPLGIVLDPSGKIFGTTLEAGQGFGTIFELTPGSGGWSETTPYTFALGSGGNVPAAGLVEDAAGNFYGGTLFGSGEGGVIFELSPSAGGWVYTVLYNFPGCGGYGTGPKAPLTLDAAGNLYGTFDGYYNDCPSGVFKLSPGQGAWTYTSLHNFTGGGDGAHPYSTVSIDANGNLFGTASAGGEGCYNEGCGVVWEITP